MYYDRMALTLPVATHERLSYLERGLAQNVVVEVVAGSTADKAGILVGDRVVTANGAPLRDIVDWKFHTAGDSVDVQVLRDSEALQFTMAKTYDEDLGIRFADDLFDRLHICKNKCVFCFLYQQPKGLRPSLYIKDDDYRLSFLHGNYVTLTNLKDGELDRICEQKLSPMFVSVHATDPEARGKILGRKGPEAILPILERLADARIQVHAQIVLVPEYNDNETLLETVTDLANLHPENRGTYGGVLSVAVVPIGITQFRERLAPVKTVNSAMAADVLDTLGALREDYLKRLGTRFVYPSDEFYLMTNRDIPSRPEYEGFPQLEDGVGLVRLFLDSLNRVRSVMPRSVAKPAGYTFVTGELAAPLLRTLAVTLSEIEGVTVNVCPVHNWFFEGNINIAGLIVGGDIVRAMETFDANDTIVIPSVMLRDGEEVFLDEMTVDQLEEKLGKRVMVIERTPEAALDAVINPGQLRRHVRDGNV